jgi:acyl-coenzyme A synthetase/AMP-(fatty) acid ligase/acyl carrier protein
MLRFFEQLQDNFLNLTNKTALAFTGDNSTISYGQLDTISGQVHCWLRDNGIGTDDHVLINLPRSAMIPAMMIGIWRNGASCIICESTMAEERIRYILADSDARIVIGQDELAEILSCESLPGFADVNLHDGAYAVYTSGTTGNPKGVLHEFGSIENAMASHLYDGVPMCDGNDIFAFNCPLNFVAASCSFINILSSGGTALVVDVETVRNPEKLMQAYDQWNVNSTFMTPSLYRACGVFNPQMSWLILGGEPCSDIYNEHIRIYNLYSSSEAARDVLVYLIEQPMEVTPVGKSQWGEEILLLDDEGNLVPDGQSGEICYKNEYVRGYIGLPEETKKAWHRGLYHTGDIAMRLPDGNIVLQGRNDDMIKIMGNRIEPAEIEKVAKKVFQLDWAVAKGFVTAERSFVVLYYQEKLAFSEQECRSLLSNWLPGYMIPSYFTQLSKIPLLPNGKLDKKALPAPDVDCFRSEYTAPSSPVEENLLAAFERVLGMEHLSINDDFYDLGGDSLRAIQLITDIQDNFLTVQMLNKHRTVKTLAQALQESKDLANQTIEDRDQHARMQSLPLTPMQYRLLDTQLYNPASTFSNMPILLRFPKKEMNTDKLLSACEKVIRNQPMLQSVISPDEELMFSLRFIPDMMPKLTVEKVTEEDFNLLKDNLIKPFGQLLNTPLYRLRIFETEDWLYLFIDLHHLIGDGTSIHVLLQNLSDAYQEKELPHDYVYLFLQDIRNSRYTPGAQKARSFNMAKYGLKDWCRHITPDHDSRSNHVSTIEVPFPVSEEALTNFLHKENMTVNTLVVAASLLMIHSLEQKDHVLVGWLFHGRTQPAYQQCVGPLFCELPVAVSFDKIFTNKQLLKEVKAQSSEGIRNAEDPYIIETTSLLENDAFRIRNQGDMYQLGNKIGFPAEKVSLKGGNPAASLMNIQVLENESGRHFFSLTYCDHRYDLSKAQKVLQLLQDYLADLVKE